MYSALKLQSGDDVMRVYAAVQVQQMVLFPNNVQM